MPSIVVLTGPGEFRFPRCRPRLPPHTIGRKAYHRLLGPVHVAYAILLDRRAKLASRLLMASRLIRSKTIFSKTLYRNVHSRQRRRPVSCLLSCSYLRIALLLVSAEFA